MKKILKFNDINCTHVGHSGGKGSSLAHITQHGIPVPRGFVISARVYDEHVDDKKIKSLLKGINVNDIEKVNEASSRLKEYILSLNFLEEVKKDIYRIFDEQNLTLVAVRSSATSEDSKEASWAGELTTLLNTSKKDVIEKTKECWASLFSPRALLYRIDKGFEDQKISVAVVVQEMVQSDIAGVCFTTHPVTNRKNQILIEAIYGLGEAIVSGQVTPDQYLYDKDYNVVLRAECKMQLKQFNLPENLEGIEWETTSKELQNRQKLTYKQILELANICKEVEKYYGAPQDIEWSFSNNTFYILQSRPITTI